MVFELNKKWRVNYQPYRYFYVLPNHFQENVRVLLSEFILYVFSAITKVNFAFVVMQKYYQT